MKKILIVSVLFLFGLNVFGQANKKPLTFDDILKWNRITEKLISNDGNTIVYKSEPWKGDPVLKIVNKSGKELKSIECATEPQITNNSKFVVFTIILSEDETRLLKLKKTKKDDMPLNKLGVYNLQTARLDTSSNLISHKIPKKWDGWIAFQTKSESVDTSKKDVDKKEKKESDKKGYILNIKNLYDTNIVQFPFVTDYIFAKEKELLAFVSKGDDKDFKPGIYFYDLKKQVQIEILTGKGDYKQLSFNKDASMLAFLADTMDDKKTDFNLYLWKTQGIVDELVNRNNEGVQTGWELSENGEITFSEKTNRIFFGIAPIKPEKDTTKLDEEIPQLDIWHWSEPKLYTEQLNSLKADQKKSYLSVYHLDTKKMIQLENEKYSHIELINNGDADQLIAWSYLPYAIQTMWEGYPEHNDFYLIDIETGRANMIKKDVRAYPNISPEGNYLYWYNAIDTSWNTYHLASEKEFKVTIPQYVQTADELNDIPNLADDYGTGGWIKNDEAFLIYDRFDIWKVDPENKLKPVNITLSGRQNKINYRILDFENMIRRANGENRIGIDPLHPIYLKGHNEITRADGYYKIDLSKKDSPKELISGKFELNTPIKAKNAEVFVFTKENFELFPDLLISETEFVKSKTISNANPQQKEFLWSTKELYTWTSLDGRKLEGLLIKPANFDPNKKYPMIVNFYEKSSQELYSHQIPEAHRSTVDYHYYSSNGYVIFNPDVYYKEGYPGEDAFNCVMPGVTQLISEGFIHEKSIAAQGHSWGGYQVAYLATRTNLFAAIESGAPVVNMFSAYGGIRLWSGMNRSFQYEHTQSRIGKSIWESPLRYLENSPIFTVDKIQTPMLIMHNEDDGAVPFGQGIEFFIALRRLGKQAWLLNYNDADHWPTLVRDKYDFQIRMAQFFDHYLKGLPMPVWMKDGLPAINKGSGMGYELIE